jgi:MFS family permease
MPDDSTTEEGFSATAPVVAPALRETTDSAEQPLSARRGLATFRALRHRNYRLYFLGQLVSLTGTWMQTPALMWLAYQLRGESRWPAWIAASQFIPTFLLGFWGGTLADRWPKRPLLFATQTGLMLLPLLLIQLVLADVTNPWPYLLVSTCTGLVLAIDFPTRLAFVMDLVGREDLTNAVALNALMFNVARLIGPLLGGALMLVAGPAPCFWINCLSYLALLLALMHMDKSTLAHPAATDRPVRGLEAGGFAYLANRPRLLALLFMAAMMGTCAWPFLSLLPALSAKVLGAPHTGYTLLLSGTGIGALSAALTVATVGEPGRNRRLIAVGIVMACTGLTGLALADRLWLAFVVCVVLGFGLIMFFSTSQSVMQLGAGDFNRGRVMGIWAMVISGAQPLGNLVAGPAADRWGEQDVLAGLAIILAGAALLTGAAFLVRHRSHGTH